MAQSAHGYLVVVEYFCPLTVYTVVIAYKNTGYKNISVIRTISPGNRFSSYSFVLEEYRL